MLLHLLGQHDSRDSSTKPPCPRSVTSYAFQEWPNYATFSVVLAHEKRFGLQGDSEKLDEEAVKKMMSLLEGKEVKKAKENTKSLKQTTGNGLF